MILIVWQRIKTLKIVFIMTEPMAMNFPLENNKQDKSNKFGVIKYTTELKQSVRKTLV